VLGAENINLLRTSASSTPIFILVIFKNAITNAQAVLIVSCVFEALFASLGWDSG
jgi:hypothetical protein